MTTPLGRIVEISGACRHLAKSRGFLSVSVDGDVIGRVPLDDIAAVIATGHGTTLSAALLSELAARGTPFVTCSRNYLPAAILWPMQGHHQQQRRMEAQLAAAKPLAKRIWAEIVAAKIRGQAAVLAERGRNSTRLAVLAGRVRSGDPENVEAQAARLYWPLLMGTAFRRETEAAGANAMLNYAYTVLRGATARAIVAAGLHPGIGIFHRHPNNSMPLADDLMEPFRPVMDRVVHGLCGEGVMELVPAVKLRIVETLASDWRTPEGVTPLSTIIMRMAASVAASYMTKKPLLYAWAADDPVGAAHDAPPG